MISNCKFVDASAIILLVRREFAKRGSLSGNRCFNTFMTLEVFEFSTNISNSSSRGSGLFSRIFESYSQRPQGLANE